VTKKCCAVEASRVTTPRRIVIICKLYVESPFACVPGVTGSNLKKRIEAIMTNRVKPGLSAGKKLVLAAAGLLARTIPVMVSNSQLRAQTGAARGASQAPPVTSTLMLRRLSRASPAMLLNRYALFCTAASRQETQLFTNSFLGQITQSKGGTSLGGLAGFGRIVMTLKRRS
jgi:hypothetical protein